MPRTAFRAAWLLPAGLLFLLVLCPLALFLVRGMGDCSGAVTLLTGGSLGRIFRFTLFQAFLSALFSTAAALPGAWMLLRYRIPGRALIRAVSTLSFLLPPILVVLGFTLAYGRAGFVNRALMALFSLPEPPLKILYTTAGIILAHVFYNFPVALRLLSDLSGVWPEHEIRAAASLGASPARIALTVVLPALWPGILSAFVLVFLYCFLSFAVVLVLGGGPATATLEVELYRAIRFDFRPDRAGALILLESAVTLPVLMGYLLLDRKLRHRFTPAGETLPAEKPGPVLSVLTAIYFVLFGLFFLLPLAAVPVHSLLVRATRSGEAVVSAVHYLSLLRSPEPLKALGSSFVLALTTAVTAVAVLFPAARVSVLDRKGDRAGLVLSLPLGISSIALGAGLLHLKTLIPSVGGFFLLAAAHTALAIPLTWRILEPAVRSLPVSVLRAGELFSSPVTRFFRIELPLLFPAVATALAFAFALSAGEVNAALLFSGPGLTTLPVTIYRLIGAYRFGEASALGTLLILTSLGALLILEHRGAGPSLNPER